MRLSVTSLPGDGIGPEVISQAIRVLKSVADGFGHELKLQEKEIGGAALTKYGNPLPDSTIRACLQSQAVLLGAVGSPSFDHNPRELRPEAGLLRLRKELGAFANLRPAVFYRRWLAVRRCVPNWSRAQTFSSCVSCWEGFTSESRDRSRAAESRAKRSTPCATRSGRLNGSLASPLIWRAHAGSAFFRSIRRTFWSARGLWREVVTRVGADYQDVQLSHMYVDSAAMALVMKPAQFDVDSYREHVWGHSFGSGRRRCRRIGSAGVSEHWRSSRTV